MNADKLNKVLSHKRTSARSKIMFLLLAKGLSLTEIVNLTPKDMGILGEIENGEELFRQYTQRKSIVDLIIKSNLLFPTSKGKRLSENNLLVSLRLPCRQCGFQLYELEFDNLVSVPNQAKKNQFKIMTLEDMQAYILEKQKETAH